MISVHEFIPGAFARPLPSASQTIQMQFKIDESTGKDTMRDPLHNGLDAAIREAAGETGSLKKFWKQFRGKDKADYREPEKCDKNFNNFYEDSDTERDKKALRKGSSSRKPSEDRGTGLLGYAAQHADPYGQGMQQPFLGRPPQPGRQSKPEPPRNSLPGISSLSSDKKSTSWNPEPSRKSQRDRRAITAPVIPSKGLATSKLQKSTKPSPKDTSAKSPEPTHYTQIEKPTVYIKKQAGDMQRTYMEGMATRGESSNKDSKGSAKTEKQRTDRSAKPSSTEKNYEPSHFTGAENMFVRSTPDIGNMERTFIEGMVSRKSLNEPSHYPQPEAEAIQSKRIVGDMQRTYIEGMVSRLNLNSKRTSKR